MQTGFNSVAGMYAAPRCLGGSTKRSYEDWANSLAAIRKFRGNTVVMKVPQTICSDPVAASEYLPRLNSMVIQANHYALDVILCLQDQVPPPCGTGSGFITDQTHSAWSAIAPTFAHNHRVSFELFNEPFYSTDNWNLWRSDMQSLVDTIRPLAKNRIYAPGAEKSMTFHGLGTHSLLKGTSIAYSAHPYNYAHIQPRPNTAWHDRWGYITSRAPVQFTEGYFDQSGLLQNEFLAWARDHGIGYSGWCIDSPESSELVKYVPASPAPTYTLTTPTGETLVSWFNTVA